MNDFKIVNKESIVERLIEVPSNVVWHSLVQQLRLFCEGECILQRLGAGRQIVADRCQPSLNSCSLHLESIEFGSNLVSRHRIVGREIDES